MIYYINVMTEVMIKTFLENWDSKASSIGTLFAYVETTA